MEKNSKLETKFTNFCEAAKGNPFKWIETVQQVGSNWYWMESREREGEMKRVQSGGDTFVDTMLKHWDQGVFKTL